MKKKKNLDMLNMNVDEINNELELWNDTFKLEDTEFVEARYSQLGFCDLWHNQFVPPYSTKSNEYLNYEMPHYRVFDNTDEYPINRNLYDSIFRLHQLTKNVNTKNKYLVIANGGTQILAALLYAISKLEMKKKKIKCNSNVPCWGRFFALPYYIPKCEFSNIDPNIEFITIPNNPDGDLSPNFNPLTKYKIYDLVYYWSSCVWNNLKEMNEEIMVFSLSKLSNNSGTRFGWALVKDKRIADEMADYINFTQLNVSGDVKKRANHVITYINEKINTNDCLFRFIKKKLKFRWYILEVLFSKSKNFKIVTKKKVSNHTN